MCMFVSLPVGLHTLWPCCLRAGPTTPMTGDPSYYCRWYASLWAALRVGVMRDCLRGSGVLRAGSVAATDSLAASCLGSTLSSPTPMVTRWSG